MNVAFGLSNIINSIAHGICDVEKMVAVISDSKINLGPKTGVEKITHILFYDFPNFGAERNNLAL